MKNSIVRTITYIVVALVLTLFIALVLVKGHNRHYCRPTNNISFSRDGKYLIASTRTGNYLWDINKNKVLFKSEPGRDNYVALSNNHDFVASWSRNKFELFDINRQLVVHSSSLPKGILNYIHFSPKDTYIVFQPLYVFNMHTLKFNSKLIENNIFNREFMLLTLNEPSCRNWLVVIYLSVEKSGKFLSVNLYDVENNEVAKKIRIPCNYKSVYDYELSLYSGGKYLFVCNLDSVIVLNLETFRKKEYKFRDIPKISTIKPHCVSHNGEWFAVLLIIPERKKISVNIYETKSGKLISKVPIAIRPFGYMAINRKRGLLAVGFDCSHDELRGSEYVIFDIYKKKKIKSLKK